MFKNITYLGVFVVALSFIIGYLDYLQKVKILKGKSSSSILDGDVTTLLVQGKNFLYGEISTGNNEKIELRLKQAPQKYFIPMQYNVNYFLFDAFLNNKFIGALKIEIYSQFSLSVECHKCDYYNSEELINRLGFTKIILDKQR